MEKNLPIPLKLNFTPNTSGCYGLRMRFPYQLDPRFSSLLPRAERSSSRKKNTCVPVRAKCCNDMSHPLHGQPHNTISIHSEIR